MVLYSMPLLNLSCYVYLSTTEGIHSCIALLMAACLPLINNANSQVNMLFGS